MVDAAATPPSPARPPLMSLDDALQRLLAVAAGRAIAEHDSVDTFAALGRVLAVPVSSHLDVPPADNTAMDGYALRAAEVPRPGTVLPVSQRIPAGTVGAPLQPGTAARIFTGAQVPAGADAVVMQEDCEALAGDPRRCASSACPRRGSGCVVAARTCPAAPRFWPRAPG